MNRKVCFVGAEITPSQGSTFVGGHVNTIVMLCKGLSKLGWEVHIITTPSRFSKDREFNFPWAKIYTVEVAGKHNSPRYAADFLLKTVETVLEIDWRESFDLIHSHSGYFSLAIIPAILRRRLGIPAIFSLYCPAQLLPTKLPVDRYGVRLLSTGLDKIVAVTENVKKSLLNYGVNSSKVEVIPSCIDVKSFGVSGCDDGLGGQLKAAGDHSATVLFVGNVEKTKGLDIFLETAEKVLQRNKDIRFVMTLHEPNEIIEKVRAEVSCKLGSSASVFGIVDDMAKLIASVDLVLVPFRSTQGISDIPLVVLEGMAAGKVVIASRLDGVMEVISDGENGFLFDLNKANDLVNTIITLVNDPMLRKEIGEKAVSYVRRYSYDVVARRLTDIYLKILE